MADEINARDYVEFVKKTTSPASANLIELTDRMDALRAEGVDVSRLLTFALGASAEIGEAVEIIKKCLLQGKPFDEKAKTHLIKECGDTFWYFSQLCIALNISFEEIMQINYEKLSSRYPDGHFTVSHSENRKDGDI
jgi:hypothetical protein